MKKNILILLGAGLLSVSTVMAQKTVDRSTMPKVGPTPQINLGQPKTFTLDNGLTVMVVENHKLPRVSASLTIDNMPSTFGNKTGVTDLTGSLLGSGTSTVSKDDFNKKIDFLGARLSFWETGANMNALSKYSDDILELMADAIINPVFTQEEFDKQQEQFLEGIKSEKKNVKTVASRVQGVLTYGNNHPYGEYVSEESISAITLDDVKNYYDVFYRPNNAYLVVVGDVKYKSIKKQISKLFANWKSGNVPADNIVTPKNATTTEIDFINMPNAVQSELAITSTIQLKRSDKDFFAVLLANKILGGGFNSYLNMNLREAHGWTYGARTSASADRYIGTFKASTSIRNAVTDSAIFESIKEIDRIKTEMVDATVLENAKKKYIGDFVLSLEKPSTIARYALRVKTNQLDEDYYEKYLQNLNAVTVEDVKRVANTYFKSNNMRIIVTGKGSDVAPTLDRLGYPVNYFDSYGNSIEKPVFKKEIPAGVTVSSIVSNYEKALGGAENISKLKSLKSVYSASMGPMTIKQTVTVMSPYYSLQEMSMGGNVMSKVVFNGDAGYMEAQGQKKEYTEEEILDAKSEKHPIDVDVYKSGKLVSFEPVDGKDAFVIELDNKKTFFDAESGFIVQQITTQVGPNGESVNTKVVFGDYKAVDGVSIPHLMLISMGPRTLEFKAESIEANPKVSKNIFK